MSSTSWCICFWIEKNNLPALVFIGDILVHKKLYLNAIKIFDDILKIDPKMYFIYNNKGFCLLSLNRIEEAKNNFERCIILKKDFAHAYNNYGITLKKFFIIILECWKILILMRI